MKPISWYKSLNTSKYRRQHGCFLIEGKRAVDQVLTYHHKNIEELICTDETAPDYSAASLPLAISVRTISALHMKSICTSKTPQGVAALLRIPDNVYTSRLPKKISANTNTCERILLLEHIQDPGNVGTLIRTAAAFGISGVILSDQCADPFSSKVIQSTAGSLLSLLIRKSGEYMLMVSELKNRGYKLIAADVDGSESRDFKIDIPHILALGNEGSGLSDDLLDKCDYRIRIPIIASGAESLNVAVSGGILMYVMGR
ncbi:MAG: RNA methyltransferase [Chitinispirillales bacterium]|jgi:TrmH family RNA methyltransferase|nr:RNA methyltransferase [Chitinispirillales bacterium]